MWREVKKNRLFFGLVTAILFLSFSFNVFGAMSNDAFRLNFKDSEALVSNQVICKGGMFNWQLLSLKDADAAPRVSDSQGCIDSQMTAYSSQFGIQGKMLALMFLGVEVIFQGLSPDLFISLAQLGTALLSAMALALFVLWVKREHGLFAGVFVSGALAISPMLVGFGRNLYWALPLMFLPLVYTLYYYRRDRKGWPLVAFWAFLGLLLYMKFLGGYEYITTMTVMVFAAIAYALYVSGASVGVYVRSALAVFVVSFVAFSAAISTHVASLTPYTGSVGASISRISERVEERTVSGGTYTGYPYMNLHMIAPGFYDVTNDYVNYEKRADSGSVVLAVLVNTVVYLLIPVVGLPVQLVQPFALYAQSTALFLLILLTLYLTRRRWLKKSQARRVGALYISLALGLLGYLSWLVLGFSHSLVHAHINGILLYLPGALFGFIILALFIKYILEALKKRFI